MRTSYKIATIVAGVVVVLMNACGSPKHLSSSQSSLIPSTDSLQLMSKVQEVINRNCASCHREGGSAVNLTYENANEYIGAGLVSPGRPTQSKLVYRLKNFVPSGTPLGANDMPQNLPAMSNDDYQIIYTWISEMSVPSTSSPFACNETATNLQDIAINDAKRLSVRQYRNTLVDLFAGAIPVATVRNLVDIRINGTYIPNDTGAFRRTNAVFSGDHLQGFFDVSDRLATDLSSSYAANIWAYFINLNPGSCTNTSIVSPSAVCRTQFVRNFASRAWRRPLREADDMQRLTNNAIVDELVPLSAEFNNVTVQEGINRVLFYVFMAPHFLFQIEDQDLLKPSLAGTTVYPLGSFAIASRLSYRFWNTMPDATLWNMAEANDLNVDVNYLQALNHVFSQNQKLDDAYREYYYDWLKLSRTPTFTVNPRFSLIASGVTFNADLRAAMINEVEDFGAYTTSSGGGFDELFLSNVSFARNADLMRIYGQTTPAPAVVTEANAVRFPASQRGGVLTRAALLASGNEFANPILRGYHIRKDMLCMELGAPPANAVDVFNSVPVPNDISTREKVQIKTSGQSCVGCHAGINPMGFALSNFNSFGQFITQEPIFNPTTNAIDTTVAVNSAVDLSPILGSGQAQNAIDYSRLIASHPSARACFAQNLMNFAFVRSVNRTRDACRLEKIYNQLDGQGRLVDAFKANALDPEWRYRRMSP